MVTVPNICIHCRRRVLDLGSHLRDAGNVAEPSPASCPVLFELRRGRV